MTTPVSLPSRSVPLPSRLDRHGKAGRNSPLAGLGVLFLFMLRRDRWWLPSWILGLTLLQVYFGTALGAVVDDQELQSLALFSQTPVMVLVGSRGYGFESITLALFIVSLYGVYLMLGSALMSLLTVSRHTRVEEQTGRAELVRANVVGRHTRLAATLLLVVLMNVLVSVLIAVVFYSSPARPDSFAPALLFGCSIGVAGLVFGAIAAVTVQLSPSSRGASGMAGAILALAFILRGLGDMSAVQGGALGFLTWLSPLGWSQQTAPIALDRWWPLLISLAATGALVIVAFSLQGRRDLGAGLLPDKLGSATAPTWLRSPLTLAFRLQRSSLVWWAIALGLSSLTFSLFVGPMEESGAGMPDQILMMMGGADVIVDGYLGFMGIYYAIMAGFFAVLSILALRGEEQSMRLEPVLATPVSRTSWLASWSIVGAGGAFVIMAIVGVGHGLGAAFATGEWSLFWPVAIGGFTHLPTVWLLLGIAVALYGWAPRLVGLTWIVLGYSALLAFFGELVQLDEAILNLGLYRHIGQAPLEPISWAAVTVMTGISATLIAVGVEGYRRRDLITT